jgi:hypothetical protein
MALQKNVTGVAASTEFYWDLASFKPFLSCSFQ